jgi:hypothetical protein
MMKNLFNKYLKLKSLVIVMMNDVAKKGIDDCKNAIEQHKYSIQWNTEMIKAPENGYTDKPQFKSFRLGYYAKLKSTIPTRMGRGPNWEEFRKRRDKIHKKAQ